MRRVVRSKLPKALFPPGEAQSLGRCLTVLAWGRNLEGQTGVEGQVVVTRPSVVMELHGVPLTSVAASKLTSAAVTESGQLYTWGDGWGGKLGHGNGDSIAAPARVEAVVDRAHMTHMALGDHHSVMCDVDGHVWACGENKEGQCGLGTPLDVIAQHRSSSQSLNHHNHHNHWRSNSSGGGGGSATQDGVEAAAVEAARVNRGRQNFVRGPPTSGLGGFSAQEDAGAAFTRKLKALITQGDQETGRAAGAGAGRRRRGSGGGGGHAVGLWASHQHQTAAAAAGMGPDVGAAMAGAAASRLGAARWGSFVWPSHGAPSGALAWGGSDLTAQLTARGVQPGQQVTPARLGRDQHPLAHSSHSLLSFPGGMAFGPSIDSVGAVGETQGIEQQRVLGVAAGRHYSLAVDSVGQVWAWGACFNGCLGSHNSWISGAQKVDGELATTLEGEGGAVAVAAGGTFAVALTASGKAVVWGTLPHPTTTTTSTSTTKGAAAARPFWLSWAGVGIEGGSGTDATSSVNSAAGGRAKQQREREREGGRARVEAGVVPGLPFLTHVAAGQQHCLLSDGQRVWLVGRALGPDGGDATGAPWDAPVEVLDTGGAGVKALRAGSHSSAVVTHTGDLWMWGRLLDRTHAGLLLRKQTERTWPYREVAMPDDSIWDWAGFGGATPALVAGLSGQVTDVALGGWHALAMLD